jgi:hypothetical protein
MKTVTFDFDVITDPPAPKRRLPEPAEETPRADAEGERRRRVEAVVQERRPNAQAAE